MSIFDILIYIYKSYLNGALCLLNIQVAHCVVIVFLFVYVAKNDQTLSLLCYLVVFEVDTEKY